MNWVDLVIIAILIFFLIEGISRPLVSETFDLISFIFAFFISLQSYSLVSKFLENQFLLPRSFANVLGFIGLWYLTEGILFLISRLTFLKKAHLLKLPGDGYLSAIPSFLRGLVFIAILLVLVGTFPIQPQIKKDVHSSIIGSWMLSRTYQLEQPLKGVFGGLANESLTFLTIKPKTNETVSLGFKTDQFNFDPQLENQMIDQVNKERVKQGLSALKFDSKLQQVARFHSADMLKRGYFSHFSPEGESVADRAEKFKVEFMVIGENLAYAPSLETAHNGLMNSPGHRANILSEDYHKIGIGVADASEYGIMFTQVFSN